MRLALPIQVHVCWIFIERADRSSDTRIPGLMFIFIREINVKSKDSMREKLKFLLTHSSSAAVAAETQQQQMQQMLQQQQILASNYSHV